MGTNCAPSLADLFLYSYENEFLDKLIKEGKRKLAGKFNLSCRYIDDPISFNNKIFKEFISDIYPKNSQFLKPHNLLQLLLISIYEIYCCYYLIRDNSNNITTKLYDKRDAFGFHIVNFPCMSNNIPSAPACGVYASQLICYARYCSNYSDFLLCHRDLVTRLLSQGYKAQSQKTQIFCIADFATLSDERRSRSKIFSLFSTVYMDKRTLRSKI